MRHNTHNIFMITVKVVTVTDRVLFALWVRTRSARTTQNMGSFTSSPEQPGPKGPKESQTKVREEKKGKPTFESWNLNVVKTSRFQPARNGRGSIDLALNTNVTAVRRLPSDSNHSISYRCQFTPPPLGITRRESYNGWEAQRRVRTICLISEYCSFVPPGSEAAFPSAASIACHLTNRLISMSAIPKFVE
jgi:hypothetical protein